MPFHEALRNYAMTLGFPKSKNLERIFEILYRDDEEIKLVAALPGTAEELAAKTGIPEEKAKEVAERLLRRGALSITMKRHDYYKRFPVIIELRDASILSPEAHENLFKLWDELIMNETRELIPVLKNLKVPPITRVVPIEQTVEARNTIMDADSARKIFEDAKLVSVIPCVCRNVARKNGRGEDCPAPEEAVCMQTNGFARIILEKGVGERITNEEALRRVRLAEEAGLVHMVRNNIKEDMFMCNCCSCCCAGLHFVNRLGYLHGVAPSRFRIKLDEDACTACGECEDRCQFHAISIEDKAVIDYERCFGCGNCALTCPEEALTLEEVRPLEHIRVR